MLTYGFGNGAQDLMNTSNLRVLGRIKFRLVVRHLGASRGLGMMSSSLAMMPTPSGLRRL